MAPTGHALTVQPEEEGLRLDAFLTRRQLAPSVAGARRLIATGQVRVGGRSARKGARLYAGEVVSVAAEAAGPTVGLPPEPGPLAVLYEDAYLVAVDKPAGVPSHPLRPGEEGTVAGALIARYPECATASPDPREGGLAHRLDVGTSGVLVAARSRAVWEALRESFGSDSGEKVYVAEVVGAPGIRGQADVAQVATDRFVVTAPIGRAGRRGARVRVAAGRGPMTARTEVQLLERRGETALMEARLARGRPHQVRAHLAHLGCPILGDDLYGDERTRDIAREQGVRGFRLHAVSIRLRHPVTGAPLFLTAPLPPWAATA